FSDARPCAVAINHPCAEIGELVGIKWRTCVMGFYPAMLRREAECDGDLEFRQRIHLPVEPFRRIRPKAVRPGQSGPEMSRPETPHPPHSFVKAMIIEVKPLAQADSRTVFGEGFER